MGGCPSALLSCLFSCQAAPRGVYVDVAKRQRDKCVLPLRPATVKGPTDGEAVHAGLLALAHGGICAVDDIAQLRGDDELALMECLDTDTVHYWSAGARHTVPAQVAVIGTVRPDRGRYAPPPLLYGPCPRPQVCSALVVMMECMT